MAYVINPDGTVTFIEVKEDRYGNLKPTGSYDLLEKTQKTGVGYSGYTPPMPRKKRKKGKRGSYYSNGAGNEVTTKPPTSKQAQSIVKNPRIITKQSIDQFFIKKKNRHLFVTAEEYYHAIGVLKGNLLAYFLQKNEKLKDYLHSLGYAPKTDQKQIKKNKSNKYNKGFSYHTPIVSGNALADIATFSIIRDSLSESDVVSVRPRTGGKPPKYGYARDYFGRVQKRDLLNEEKKNEFKQSQKQQSNYDYSNYDSEDDHDSYYDSGSYE